MLTPDAFRKIALAIPSAVERSHMDHLDFRVRGKIFASLGVPDEAWGMVKLTPEQQRKVMKEAPKAFKPCNGAWGRQGCTNVQLASVGEATLRAALEAAACNITSPAHPRRAARPRPT